MDIKGKSVRLNKKYIKGVLLTVIIIITFNINYTITNSEVKDNLNISLNNKNYSTNNVTLNYMDEEGASWIMSEPHECFVDDPNRKNRHFKIDYSIFLTDYKDVKVDFEIDNATIEKYEMNGTSIIIPIERENSGIFINGEEILQNKYMGAYTLRATLTYIIAGKEVVRTRSLTFTIVPSGLYVNVRTNRDVLYDSVDKLIEDIKAGVNKHITIGSSLMLYCKVFEGDIIGDKLRYTTYFQPFDTIVDGEGNIIYSHSGYTPGSEKVISFMMKMVIFNGMILMWILVTH